MYYYISEDELDTSSIHSATQLLIIPSFTINGDNSKYYIDSLFNKVDDISQSLSSFLARGGTIYAEGNAAYFLEKLGYLQQDAVDFDNAIFPDPTTNLLDIRYTNSTNPLAYTSGSVGN